MLALIIDDELALRTVCQRLISAMGHECHAAANVAEAVAETTANTFDLIICDYRLGPETAADVIAALQESAPKQVSAIVLASGDSSGGDVSSVAARYKLRVISKPFGRSELSELLTEAG